MEVLEKAVLKTLAYSGVFDFPLAISEIHQYLVEYRLGNQSELGLLFRDQDHGLPILERNGFFVLNSGKVNPGGLESFPKRREREARAWRLLKKAQDFSDRHFARIPWVRLVAVTGSVAALNADQEADIDLLVVAGGGTVWLVRALVLLILERKGERIDLRCSGPENAGRFCLNIIIDESGMQQRHQDLYTANEIARMKVVLNREKTYERFLEANSWMRKFLPNWKPNPVPSLPSRLLPTVVMAKPFERISRWYQLRNRRKWEQVKTDHRERVLVEYEMRVKRFLGDPTG